MKKIVFYIICNILCFHTAFGQEQPLVEGDRDAYLAKQFFENGAYDKAAEYYEVLIQKPNGYDLYYEDYKQTLIALKDWVTAKKLVKTIYKESGKDPVYLLELGQIYQMSGDIEEADKQYESLIKSLKPVKFEYLKIANKFIEVNELDWALKTYEAGKKQVPDASYNYEIGTIYRLQNNKEGMLSLYLEEVLSNPTSLKQVQNGLQAALTTQEDFTNLETILLQNVQKHKETLVYQDLLVWLYMQMNDFESALAQAKYLDLKRDEGGANVIQIARSAAQQKDYDAAIKGYQFVIDKGAENDYYVTATLEMLNVKRDKIISGRNYSEKDLYSLRDAYKKFLDEYYNPYTSSKAVIDLAKLNALYIHDLDTAISNLEILIGDPKVDKNLKAQAKLDLGDYYILKEEPWESVLLYTQVEKDFKGNPTGEEAKYKNARLSYYKGDFEWAQTQLKVIKGNTSEYISNDAIDLSVFITDNLGMDSTLEPMMLFSQADLLKFQNKLEASEEELDKILSLYPNHSLTDDVYWLKAQLELEKRHFNGAIEYLKDIVENYGSDLWGDNALFLWADIVQNNLNDTEQAKELYEKLILDYQGSTFMVEARKRYRILRGEKINEQ